MSVDLFFADISYVQRLTALGVQGITVYTHNLAIADRISHSACQLSP